MSEDGGAEIEFDIRKSKFPAKYKIVHVCVTEEVNQDDIPPGIQVSNDCYEISADDASNKRLRVSIEFEDNSGNTVEDVEKYFKILDPTKCYITENNKKQVIVHFKLETKAEAYKKENKWFEFIEEDYENTLDVNEIDIQYRIIAGLVKEYNFKKRGNRKDIYCGESLKNLLMLQLFDAFGNASLELDKKIELTCRWDNQEVTTRIKIC